MYSVCYGNNRNEQGRKLIDGNTIMGMHLTDKARIWKSDVDTENCMYVTHIYALRTSNAFAGA